MSIVSLKLHVIKLLQIWNIHIVCLLLYSDFLFWWVFFFFSKKGSENQGAHYTRVNTVPLFMQQVISLAIIATLTTQEWYTLTQLNDTYSKLIILIFLLTDLGYISSLVLTAGQRAETSLLILL